MIFKKIRAPFWILSAIILAAIALRLINLGTEPYWGDEILSLDISTRSPSVPDMLRYLQEVEVHPPLYYLMERTWAHWFGDSQFAIRTLSLIFGVLTILATYWAALVIFRNRLAAYLASGFMAILPIQIEFSQEARPYIIFCFFGIIAATALWKIVHEKKRGFLLLYVICALAGLYLHYSFALFLFALCVWWLAEIFFSQNQNRGRAFLDWLGAHAAILLGFAYWLPALLYKLLLSNYPIFGLERHIAIMRPNAFFETILDQLIWVHKIGYDEKILILLKMLGKILLIGLFIGFFLKRNQSSTPNIPQPRKALLFLTTLLVLPLILFLFIPQSVAYSTINARHMILLSFPFVLLTSFIATALPGRKTVAALTIFALTLIPYISEVTADDSMLDQNFRVEEIGEYINQYYRDGDLVITVYPFPRSNLAHYLRPDIPLITLLPTNYYGLDFNNDRHRLGFVENEFQTRFKPDKAEQIFEKLMRLEKKYHPKRIWFYGLTDRDDALNCFLEGQQWRHGIKAISDVILLDLLTKTE